MDRKRLFDTLPPHLVHISIEWLLMSIMSGHFFCPINQWTFSILRTLEIFQFGDGWEQDCLPSVGWTIFWTLFSLVFWTTIVRKHFLWDKLIFELNVVYGCPLQTICVALEHPIESNRTLQKVPEFWTCDAHAKFNYNCRRHSGQAGSTHPVPPLAWPQLWRWIDTIYHISTNSYRGNYLFLKVENIEIFI